MKTVYFVRHGESGANAGNVLRGPGAMLTEKGKQQAAFIARRCAKLPIDVIISSTYPRAMDTAQAVIDQRAKPIEYSDLFVERRQPSHVIGLLKNDPQYLHYVEELKQHGHEPQWRFEDAENFADLKVRTGSALQYLESRAEENILVVTHGLFMRVLLARVVMGEDLNGLEYQRFIQSTDMENTGLTVFKYQRPGSWTPWEAWIWNDHSHLAE